MTDVQSEKESEESLSGAESRRSVENERFPELVDFPNPLIFRFGRFFKLGDVSNSLNRFPECSQTVHFPKSFTFQDRPL